MENFELTIEALKKKVEEKERELIDTKKGVNQVCLMMGKEPIYVVEETEINKVPTDLKGDEYYMQPLARVIATILENRRIRGSGPTTIKEIYDQMTAGGYLFETKNAQNAMRGIRISMSKNVATFHKLPSGKFGLTGWYPDLKEPKEPKKSKRRKRKTTTAKTIEQIETTKDEREKPKRGRPKKSEQSEPKQEGPKE